MKPVVKGLILTNILLYPFLLAMLAAGLIWGALKNAMSPFKHLAKALDEEPPKKRRRKK